MTANTTRPQLNNWVAPLQFSQVSSGKTFRFLLPSVVNGGAFSQKMSEYLFGDVFSIFPEDSASN